MAPEALNAYIDEAGQRSSSAKSSDHFVMSAVLVRDADLSVAQSVLSKLRIDLDRQPGDTLHWRNLKGHSPRLHAAATLGVQPWATVSSVVVCKRHLPSQATLNDDQAYLFTLRFLLERLSWFARDGGFLLTYTLAHVVRFKLATLRGYEAILKGMSGVQIAWNALNPAGGQIDQPSRLEMLQYADIAASATFAAFEPDKFGNTEDRYLRQLAPRLYRRPPGPLTSYGLKMHPWSGTTRAAYPWVAAL